MHLAYCFTFVLFLMYQFISLYELLGNVNLKNVMYEYVFGIFEHDV